MTEYYLLKLLLRLLSFITLLMKDTFKLTRFSLKYLTNLVLNLNYYRKPYSNCLPHISSNRLAHKT